MRSPFVSPALVLLGALATAPTQAADAVTDAIQVAYAPYRQALFRTNGGSQAQAQQALDAARQAWKDLRERVGSRPGAPYERDAAFGETLQRVAQVYDKAAEEVAAGQLSPGHETLEQTRDLLADLRQRNGVVTYSDAMNAYHAEMERLLVEGPRWMASPQAEARMAAQVGVLEYLSSRLRTLAPPDLRRVASFEALLKDVEASVAALGKASLEGDLPGLKEAMARLKAPYSKLFLNFG